MDRLLRSRPPQSPDCGRSRVGEHPIWLAHRQTQRPPRRQRGQVEVGVGIDASRDADQLTTHQRMIEDSGSDPGAKQAPPRRQGPKSQLRLKVAVHPTIVTAAGGSAEVNVSSVDARWPVAAAYGAAPVITASPKPSREWLHAAPRGKRRIVSAFVRPPPCSPPQHPARSLADGCHPPLRDGRRRVYGTRRPAQRFRDGGRGQRRGECQLCGRPVARCGCLRCCARGYRLTKAVPGVASRCATWQSEHREAVREASALLAAPTPGEIARRRVHPPPAGRDGRRRTVRPARGGRSPPFLRSGGSAGSCVAAASAAAGRDTVPDFSRLSQLRSSPKGQGAAAARLPGGHRHRPRWRHDRTNDRPATTAG